MVHGIYTYSKKNIIYTTQILKEHLVQCWPYVCIFIRRSCYGILLFCHE